MTGAAFTPRKTFHVKDVLYFPTSNYWPLLQRATGLLLGIWPDMGIILQRTCFNAPATLSYASEDTSSFRSAPPAQGMLQKRHEFDEMLNLARVMAYVCMLDPALFTPDQELIATAQTLTECLFPPSFDSRKIGRISRKIAETSSCVVYETKREASPALSSPTNS